MEFYTFERSDQSDAIRYTFYTDNNLTYIAFFISALDFTDHFEGHDYFSEFGWVCGFGPVEDGVKIPGDRKISQTISQIFIDFLSNKPKEVVLIYHCDDDKDQQLARSRKFNGWFLLFSEAMNLSIEITQLDIVTGETIDLNFIGYIYSNEADKEKVLGEAKTFSQYLLASLRK